MKTIVTMLAAVLAMTALAAPALAAEELQIEGSTTVGPIADAFVEAFKKIHPDVKYTVKKTGSGDGARALVDGTCDIAAMSRFMKPKEFKKAVANGIMPVAHAIAMDGVCVVVHPSNPVKNLTTEQIQKIYTGEIKNWSQLGGPNKAIVPYTRDSSSGTYETFHKLAMHKKKMGSSVQTVSSNPNMKTNVAKNDGAIGYVGLGFVDDSIKPVNVDGIEATEQTIALGKYPISRPLFFFTNGYPKLGTIVFQFCNFYLSEQGQEIVRAKGFIPLTTY